jgi:CRP-like cAMP-binding protein
MVRQPDSSQTLDGIELLQAMTPEARRALAGRCRWQRVMSGQQIVGHLDTTRDVFFVVEGRVRATSYSLSGKEVSYRDIGAGDMVGEFSAIDGAPRSADVIALVDCLVATISADLFWQVLQQHPEVAAATLKSLTGQLRALTERVFEFSALAVNNRIHAELLRLARLQEASDNTAVITPAPTHAELASRISTHREAVTRELNALARAGLVERDGNALRITDVAELSRMVELVLGEQL